MDIFLLILSLFFGSISQDHKCLTEAIYFEAGNQSISGKLAVGNVIKNRVNDERWPDSFCEVIRAKHQFSYYWDGKSDRIPKKNNKLERLAARDSRLVSLFVLMFDLDNTRGSLYYHSTKINPPHWTKNLDVELQIESHILYTEAYK